MVKRVGIASAASWTMFLVTLLWLPWAIYRPPREAPLLLGLPLLASAPKPPSIVLCIASDLKETLPNWVWRPAIAWYELLAFAVLALWVGIKQQESGLVSRIGFWLAIINPFFPPLLALMTIRAWG